MHRDNKMGGIYKLVLVVFIYLILTSGSFAQQILAYVSNRDSNDISIIDTSTNLVVDTINVGPKPRGMAINPSCSRLYVTVQDSDEVVVIDTKNNNVVARIEVGDEPFAIDVHPSGSPVYVANWEDEYVSVIDANTNEVTASNIAVGNQQQIVAFNPSGTHAFVSHRGDKDSVSVIDTNKNKVDVSAIPVGTGNSDPRDIAFNPTGSTAYVTLRENDGISLIDTKSQNQRSIVKVGDDPVNIVLTRDGSRAYVTNNDDNNVSVINLVAGNEIVTTVAVGQTPNGLAITPDGRYLYVANKDDTVSIIETESNTVIKTISAGDQPWDVAICQIPPKNSQKYDKRTMQIYGRIFRDINGDKVLSKEKTKLILDCDGIIQEGESSSDGQYKLLNNSGIRECKLKVGINEVTTSWPPVEVIFSSKPRSYDVVY